MTNQFVGIGLKSISLSGSERPGSNLGFGQSMGAVSRILAPLVVGSFETYEEPIVIAISSALVYVAASFLITKQI
jgi:hypothetical protein